MRYCAVSCSHASGRSRSSSASPEAVQSRSVAVGTNRGTSSADDPNSHSRTGPPTSMTPFDDTAAAPRTWTTRRALAAHTALALWVPGCAVACWWQVGIALSGDALGWVYSVMWPCFAVFGVVFWWHFIHDDPNSLGVRGVRRLRAAAGHDRDEPEAWDHVIADAEAEDTELAEYNAYLAALAREGPATWRRGRSG